MIIKKNKGTMFAFKSRVVMARCRAPLDNTELDTREKCRIKATFFSWCKNQFVKAFSNDRKMMVWRQQRKSNEREDFVPVMMNVVLTWDAAT